MSNYRNSRYQIADERDEYYYKNPKRYNRAIHKERYSVKYNYSIFNTVFLIPIFVFGVFVLCLFLGVHL